jgi:hypothetical protein
MHVLGVTRVLLSQKKLLHWVLATGASTVFYFRRALMLVWSFVWSFAVCAQS